MKHKILKSLSAALFAMFLFTLAIPLPAHAQATSVSKGTYLVGKDIPAGEYLLESSRTTYVEVTSDSSGSFESIVTNDNYIGRKYLSVLDGQYFKLKGGKATLSSLVPAYVSDDGTYPPGMYLVGKDMPAGEYLITSSKSCYMEVSSTSFGNFDSIFCNDNFTNRKYITVVDGQYLSFTSGSAVLSIAVPAYTPAPPAYPSGMYLVGKDIPAGEYIIAPENEGRSGYYEVDSNSVNTFESILVNDNIDAPTYQTLANGQYIELSRTKILLQ